MTRILLEPADLVRSAGACAASAEELRRAAARLPGCAAGLPPALAPAADRALADARAALVAAAAGLAEEDARLRRAAALAGSIAVGPFGLGGVALAGASLALPIGAALRRPPAAGALAALDAYRGARTVTGGAASAAPRVAALLAGRGAPAASAAALRIGERAAAVDAVLASPALEAAGRAAGGVGLALTAADTVGAVVDGRYVDASGGGLEVAGGALLLLGASGPVGWAAGAALATGLAIEHRRELARGVAAAGRVAWRGAGWAGGELRGAALAGRLRPSAVGALAAPGVPVAVALAPAAVAAATDLAGDAAGAAARRLGALL